MENSEIVEKLYLDYISSVDPKKPESTQLGNVLGLMLKELIFIRILLERLESQAN